MGPIYNLQRPGATEALVEPAVAKSASASDYQLIEDGRKTARSKATTAFRQSNWKAAFVLALDVSRSISKQDFSELKTGTIKFINDATDPVALIAFGDTTDVIANFDVPRAQAIAAVSQLRIVGRTTRLYDALDNCLKLLEGRPAPERAQIVVISDGAEDSHGGPDSIDWVLAKAERRRIPINTIWIPTSTAGARNTLVRASERTDGLYADARLAPDIEKALAHVAARLDQSVIVSFQRNLDKSALTKEIAILDNRAGVASAPIALQIAASAPDRTWNDRFKAFVEFLSNVKTLMGLLGGTAAALGLYLASFVVVKIYFPERVSAYPVFLTKMFEPESKVSLNPPLAPKKPDDKKLPERIPRRTIVEHEGELMMRPILMLEAVDGPLKGTSIPVQSDRFRIGADPQSDLAIPTDDYVSGRHARIEAAKGQWLLTDESRNGTFVDGKRIDAGSSQVLRTGQRIRIGGSEFRVIMDADPKTAHARAGSGV